MHAAGRGWVAEGPDRQHAETYPLPPPPHGAKPVAVSQPASRAAAWPCWVSRLEGASCVACVVVVVDEAWGDRW